MNDIRLLGRRAIREAIRMPEATIPILFIPIFFLAVNVGQLSKTYSSSTPFLKGQNYAGFQIPVSLMFAVCTATSGLALVTEIDSGYFDKLLVTPIRRSSIIFGRLCADFVRGAIVSVLVLLVGLGFGIHIASGPMGALVLILLCSFWGVAYAGIGILIALRTRSVQATNASFIVFFPLLFLTPNVVPFDLLSPLMKALAQANPVSYLIIGVRSLVLDGWVWSELAAAFAVILGTGTILTWLSVRAINNYDR